MIMADLINEEYVRGILADVAKQPKPLSRDDFYGLCRTDIHAGYGVEVDAGAHRYFARRNRRIDP